MKGSELKRILKENGCEMLGEYTNHEKWYSPISKREFPIPRHDSQEVRTGTLNKILKDAGLK